jgi:hypothetical protein
MAIRVSPEHVTKGPYSSSGSRATALFALFVLCQPLQLTSACFNLCTARERVTNDRSTHVGKGKSDEGDPFGKIKDGDCAFAWRQSKF